MVIRKAEAQDSAAVFRLAQAFATSFAVEQVTFNRAFAELIKAPKAFVTVAEQEEEVAGYLLGFEHLTFFANGRVAWVEEIMVGEAYRHLGIGRQLMEAFEAWAQKRDAKIIALATRRASGFYRALGYEESAIYFRKMMLQEGIQERAARASREKFEAVLAKVPDAPPEPQDALNQ